MVDSFIKADGNVPDRQVESTFLGDMETTAG